MDRNTSRPIRPNPLIPTFTAMEHTPAVESAPLSASRLNGALDGIISVQ